MATIGRLWLEHRDLAQSIMVAFGMARVNLFMQGKEKYLSKFPYEIEFTLI
jgi:hypothetical protein